MDSMPAGCVIRDLDGNSHNVNFKAFESDYINCDCMEALRNMPDKCVGLAIIDPPYGIGENGDKNHTRDNRAKAKDYKAFAGNDLNPLDAEYFAELFRVSKNQIIFGANHFIHLIPIDSSCWIVWDKDNTGDFADCELAWTSFPTAVRKFKYRWNGMIQENMKNKEFRIHPTQKPVALYEWLLSHYANPGDIILDTHAGSASSLIACHKSGYPYLGFELDREYYKKSKERLETEKAQITIFDFIERR